MSHSPDFNQFGGELWEIANVFRDDALHADFGWALGVVFRAYRKSANAVIADMPGGPRGYPRVAPGWRNWQTRPT